jgi:UDP-N-acetylmuramoyl-tripeptide--D-alanyl-D-alanine ligase
VKFEWLLYFPAAGAAVLSGLRWLRVAQREHYIPGSVGRFAGYWLDSSVLNKVLWIGGWIAALASLRWPSVGLVTFGVVAVWPVELAVRGRTSPLRWTRRLRTLAAVTSALLVGGTAVLGLTGKMFAAIWVAGVPIVMEVALVITRPIERTIGRKYVHQATEKLERVKPVVVAVTGSYGKTTTKAYIAHLLSGNHQVLASPASFNNTAGLSRAINEHLAPGTDVFVAEMGAYGLGEIAEMCSWVKPTIGVITAIGPVHLERFRTLDRTARAKAEILAGVRTGVINADEPRLAPAGDALVARGGTVIRCSTKDETADVAVLVRGEGLEVRVRGESIASLEARPGFPMNVACAVGVAIALDTPAALIAKLLPTLPTPEHRQSVTASSKGVVIIDDSYNSNPAGAAAALDLLVRHSSPGRRRVVVTPGMVEMGRLQREANREFAASASKVATDFLVVGRTNRRALLEGAREGGAAVTVVATREGATAWAREHLGPGDAILYENDLPDHYP